MQELVDSKEISEDEAYRILSYAETLEDAQKIWENQDWWNDSNFDGAE